MHLFDLVDVPAPRHRVGVGRGLAVHGDGELRRGVERRRDVDAAAAAGDVRPAGCESGHRAVNGGGTRVVREDAGAGHVDATLRQRAGRLYGAGLSHEQPDERRCVDTDVQYGAGAEGRVEQPVLGRLVGYEAEVGPDSGDVSERPRGGDVAHGKDVGVAPHPHGFHEEQALAARCCNELGGVGRVEGQRLLAEHGLAGVEAHQHVVTVHRVRRRDVDDVDVGVRDELLVAAVRAGHAVFVREALRGLQLPRPDSGEFSARRTAKVGGEGRGDVAGGQQAPSDRFHGRRPLGSFRTAVAGCCKSLATKHARRGGWQMTSM